jgi:hypothetical protein
MGKPLVKKGREERRQGCRREFRAREGGECQPGPQVAEEGFERAGRGQEVCLEVCFLIWGKGGGLIVVARGEGGVNTTEGGEL